MKPIFFTPGPSQLYPTVSGHIRRALKDNILSLSHRESQYQRIQERAVEGVRTLLSVPSGHAVFFVSSGTEAMERTIQNCVEKRSLHCIQGAFSQRFFATAQDVGKQPESFTVPWGQSYDPSSIPVGKETELLCITQNETSTGVSIPVHLIKATKKRNPNLLIAVDIVSSVPYVNLDYHAADVVFFSVQKGFGLPAGLGVMIVSPQAMEKAAHLQKKNVSIGSYHSFLSLAKEASVFQTPETPNVMAIYLLANVCADMCAYGIAKIRKETEKKAALLYRAIEQHPALSSFVVDSSVQSHTVIVATVRGESGKLVERLKHDGCVIGSGYGKYKQTQIRIANFPAHSPTAIRRLIRALNNG